MISRTRTNRSGFTIPELLVVTVIALILMSILATAHSIALDALRNAKRKATWSINSAWPSRCCAARPHGRTLPRTVRLNDVAQSASATSAATGLEVLRPTHRHTPASSRQRVTLLQAAQAAIPHGISIIRLRGTFPKMRTTTLSRRRVREITTSISRAYSRVAHRITP